MVKRLGCSSGPRQRVCLDVGEALHCFLHDFLFFLVAQARALDAAAAVADEQLGTLRHCFVHAGVDRGSVIDEPAARLFEAPVKDAVAQGAKLLVGNRRCGIKDSGLGYKEDKEGVQEAMKSFTNVKTYSLPWA